MQYICIDLKSFYASVECMQRGLDPLNTNLVVADKSRTEKTICLAVTPSLKAYGIPGRARLFEVIGRVKEVNRQRLKKTSSGKFSGASCLASELNNDLSLELDFIVAPPQMATYMKISTDIYKIYLKYISPDDIHVYSIDEVFINAAPYLRKYRCTARELAVRMIKDVLSTTGITATAGIGTNLYLSKIAMDIVAKKMPADKDGVRIAELDEMSYRQKLWSHRPITDFWRVGKGISRRLESIRVYTMGDIAELSVRNEDVLYRMFGINAELLIDHAWGWEPCTISQIKSYHPENHSISRGQVLSEPYTYEKARLICREMSDALALELVRKTVACDQLILDIGYDGYMIPDSYDGKLCTDGYGRKIPEASHGSVNLGRITSSSRLIITAMMKLYERITDPGLMIRRITVAAVHVVSEPETSEESIQYSLFEDNSELELRRKNEKNQLERERRLQTALLSIKDKYGKNAVLKGMNFMEGATAKERNAQVGGHKA